MKPSCSRKPRGRRGSRSNSGGRGKRAMEQLNADDILAELNPSARLQAEGWFMEEMDKLMDFRRELDAQFKTTYPDKNLSEHISDKMKEKGIDWSPPVCAMRLSELLMEYFNLKLQKGESVSSNLSYDEMVDYVASKKKAAAEKEPVNQEAHSGSNFAGSGNQRFAFNGQRGVDHGQSVFGINMTDTNAANEVSAGHQPGRVITVKWGECVRKIGIDGSPEAIKEVIKAAFGLRTARQFWLEDQFGILRTIDRDMPMGNYTLYVDEGLTIRVYLDSGADESPLEAEEMTFYTEDEFRDFLRHCGFTALTDLSCRKHVHSIDDIHHGEAYQGFKATAN